MPLQLKNLNFTVEKLKVSVKILWVDMIFVISGNFSKSKVIRLYKSN